MSAEGGRIEQGPKLGFRVLGCCNFRVLFLLRVSGVWWVVLRLIAL